MIDDSELLRQYAEEKSQAAFAELVRRRIGLVHSVALRHTGGDAHRAQDVTQVVFTALARKAPALCRRPVLTGWLYRSAQFAASDAVRAERRRQERAQEAHAMQEINREGKEPDWEELRPALDEALETMDERDRDAVALRFIEGQPFAQIGARLRVSENAARMRVERALEKLRERLARRGVTSTTAALATLLASEAAAVAPAGLAAGVASAATAAAGVGGFAAAMTFMALNKLQVGLVSAAVLGGGAGFVIQAQSQDALRAEMAGAALQFGEMAALRAENARLRQTAAEVAELRGDDAELVRLRDRADEIKARMSAASRDHASRIRAAWETAAAPRTTATGFLDILPTARFLSAPVYPPELRAAGVSGEVLVSFIVDSNGNVREPFAIQSTLREFEGPAIEAMAKWIFHAASKGGRMVNTRMQIPIVFTVGGDDGAAITSKFGSADKESIGPGAVTLAPFEVKAQGGSHFHGQADKKPHWF